MSKHRERCPTCLQTLPLLNKRQRICSECGLPVTSNHKWTFQISEGKASVVHRHCKTT